MCCRLSTGDSLSNFSAARWCVVYPLLLEARRSHSRERRVARPSSENTATHVTGDIKLLAVGVRVVTKGAGRWLAVAASLVVSAAMIHAQGTKPRCCAETPAAAPVPPPAPPRRLRHPAHRTPPAPPRSRRSPPWHHPPPPPASNSSSRCPAASRPRIGYRSRLSGRPARSECCFRRSKRSTGIRRTPCRGIPRGWRST